MRSKFKLIAVSAIVVSILFACSTADQSATVDIEKVKPEIQAIEDAFAAAEKAKDADKVVAYYSDDAVSYGRNRVPEVGKAAIKESLAKRLAADTIGNLNVYKVVIFYLFYAVIAGKIDKWIWIGLGLFLLEGLVLLVFKMKCPLTVVARRYSNSTKENFDIYLPNWVAKYNKLIYTSILLIVIAILIYRLVF